MSWIRRHLTFVLTSLVTLGLLVAAFIFAVSGYTANRRAFTQLDEALVELKQLFEMDPHPGTDKIDNIAIAKEQQKQLRAFLEKAAERFVPVPPIPNSPQVTTEEFTAQLNRTIDQLQRDATSSGVALPPKYNFTFESIRRRVTFSTNSLPVLAAKLGEVKAICDILFRARIHSLDNLRRERVCPEDSPETVPSDYLDKHSVTNELAILTPFEITFRCFTSELAGVLGGFASSPYCFVIKHIDIGPAGAVAPEGMYSPEGYVPGVTPGYPARPGMPEDPYRRGLPGYGRTPYERGAYAREIDVGAPAPTPGVRRAGGQLALDEQMFRVVLTVDVVKLNLPK
ncbi:MAG: Amuc_1100 family pilus-like protein [Verrucomicrobiae bacterium]|nr:Amuc_1100 family pilus-like protein [Verrucomicrobiae bacterium]MDW7980055.1 Amuc_1100 family pilus-like protein [Verrucomicrobiales bacterium]